MNRPEKIYIASDLHLGAPDPASSLVREKRFVRFLQEVAHDATELYLLGDVFDFWFEYKRVVPRGYVRLLGQLATMADAGIKIHLFAGNHDLWYGDYLQQEIGATIYREPISRIYFGRRYYLAHGDGLGPGDHGYKLMKRVFTHPLSRWLFARLHPNFGVGLALRVSQHGGNHHYQQPQDYEEPHKGEREFLYHHARAVHAQDPGFEAFIFGHRHLLIDDQLKDGPRVIILGDWIQYDSYLTISESGCELSVFA
ncbi:MAG: UDP-2,3-diacylglucosamine diphosphatase [Bacteroidetes bacterium]|nr:MAG: UDP-2,3-diacylglucosamine diphosphatase [Bacteroidota bacterium]